MRILSFNPGHDGAAAYLVDGRLIFSVEAEKDSNPRYAQLSREYVARTLDALGETPDVICAGGWWLHETRLADLLPHVGYRGIATGRRDVLGKAVRYFSSSHVVDGRIYLRQDSERYRAHLCEESDRDDPA